MKVAMFSRDPKAIVPGTVAFARMEKYRALVDQLDIYVPGLNRLYVGPGYDLVTSQDPFETGVVAWVNARLTGARLELQVHTDFLAPAYRAESIKNKIRAWLATFLLPRADCIRVVSRRISDSLRTSRFALRADPVILPIFVDMERMKAASGGIDLHVKYPQFSSIFLMASRIVREKNIGMAIEAMAEIVKTHPDAGLIIVGDGPLRGTLVDETRDMKLETNVLFESWSENLAPYYKSADAFVLTSNYEGYALSLVEAAVLGTPIITTDVGVVGDLISKEDALVVPVGDTRRLVDAMRFALDDPNWDREIRQRLPAIATRLDSMDGYLEKLKRSWVTCGTSPRL